MISSVIPILESHIVEYISKVVEGTNDYLTPTVLNSIQEFYDILHSAPTFVEINRKGKQVDRIVDVDILIKIYRQHRPDGSNDEEIDIYNKILGCLMRIQPGGLR